MPERPFLYLSIVIYTVNSTFYTAKWSFSIVSFFKSGRIYTANSTFYMAKSGKVDEECTRTALFLSLAFIDQLVRSKQKNIRTLAFRTSKLRSEYFSVWTSQLVNKSIKFAKLNTLFSTNFRQFSKRGRQFNR